MKAFQSIRWRLLVWQMILLAGVLVTLLTLHYQLKKRDLIAGVDGEIQEALMIVMPIVSPPSDGPRANQPGQRPAPGMLSRWDNPFPGQMQLPQIQQPVDIDATEFLDHIEQHDVFLVVKTLDEMTLYGTVPQLLKNDLPSPAAQPRKITRAGNRLLIHSHNQIQIMIGRPLTKTYATLALTRFYLVGIGGTVLLIGFIGGLLIIGRALRPIGKISDTAKTIAEGDHRRRIELSDAPEELSGLADTLNKTFDHLHESIENQKRFSADASHELRTPIAVVIAQAEAALKRDRSPEEYRNVLNACLRAGRRMKSMANSLLELTRIDSQASTLSTAPCDLNEVLSGAVDSASLLSEKHSVSFQGLEQNQKRYSRSPEAGGEPAVRIAGILPAQNDGTSSENARETPRVAEIDRDRIHQVVMNLISNAMQHNPQGCEITVRLKQDGIIEIADNGIGIPEESLPHIFERFYRVDKSRSREQGGVGLGLSIVKSLVEAHGGTITAASVPNLGTTFTICLPLAG